MDIRPIFSALLKHKTSVALIVLEIALSCTIICNALFVVDSRLRYMHRESGVVENELLNIDISSLNSDRSPEVVRQEDVAALASIPGVTSVTSLSQLPYGSRVMMSGVARSPDLTAPILNVSTYMDDGKLLPTLGLRVLAGRAFTQDEYFEMNDLYKPSPTARFSAALVTRSLAEHLFGTTKVVGQTIYCGGPVRIVGVINDLINSRPSGGSTGQNDYDSIIFPARPAVGSYALRTSPAYRENALKAAAQVLTHNDPNRIIGTQATVTAMRHDFYRRDRAVVWLLVVISVLLLSVTALGIIGLASFWVQQRTKQIGIRRALGATRFQILLYFLTENFMLTTFGILLGMMGAFGINQYLMAHYELPRLPLLYLPVGALLLWLLGLIAVSGPARRAASIPPALALAAYDRTP